MIKIAEVKFSEDQMPRSCLVENSDIDEGDVCVIERDKSQVVGRVATLGPHPCLSPDHCHAYPRVLRRANEKEVETWRNLQTRQREARTICKRKVEEHKLPMKISTVEIDEPHNKIVFHFTADKRVDFRALVRDLAASLHARIELWQIGVRDEAKIIDGFGVCGRRLCCSGFFTEFKPISIRMAKNQDIALAPSKLSGCCGRLMCCLAYEESTYVELAKRVPPVGALIRADHLKAIVVDRNVLKQTVLAQDLSEKLHTVHINKIQSVSELRDKKGRRIKRLKDLEVETDAEETPIMMAADDREES